MPARAGTYPQGGMGGVWAGRAGKGLDALPPLRGAGTEAGSGAHCPLRGAGHRGGEGRPGHLPPGGYTLATT